MWNEICEKVFVECTNCFEQNGIKYFVLRNFDELPKKNAGKDVDIIIFPGQLKKAKKILKEVYRKNGLPYYDEAIFDRLHCTHGMGIESHTGIHIDLMEGLVVKGFEFLRFEDAFQHIRKSQGFFAIDEFYEGLLLLVYKLFGYKKPVIKEKYWNKIRKAYQQNQEAFQKALGELVSPKLSEKICYEIQKNHCDAVISYGKILNKKMRRRIFGRRPVHTMLGILRFVVGKADRIIFRYGKYSRTFAVLGPDGVGKSTFIEQLINQLNEYYVSDAEDQRFHLYHFRPTLFPNLGMIGKKEEKKNEKGPSDPHGKQAAGRLSSLFRIMYYTTDYILGWMRYVRQDVHYDRFSVFDRYSYDLLVDPLRTRLNLREGTRRFFVKLTPKPKIIFILTANPETIYARKQELSPEEIERQQKEYIKISKRDQRVRMLSTNETMDEVVAKAVKIVLEEYGIHERAI
ncbi:MAG: hypothetical protein K6G85_04140 [Eubacterium sp.]|nr:hypothetical protein [Eubacterium sp.]